MLLLCIYSTSLSLCLLPLVSHNGTSAVHVHVIGDINSDNVTINMINRQNEMFSIISNEYECS